MTLLGTRTLLVAPGRHGAFRTIGVRGCRRFASTRCTTLGRMPDTEELRTLATADVLVCVE